MATSLSGPQGYPYGGSGSGGGNSWVDPKAVPIGDNLKKYCLDVTQMARDGKLDPVIGREEEIRRTIEILSRRYHTIYHPSP
jgi:ATP-dependent Clp protease ATP-binding subunit ClpB